MLVTDLWRYPVKSMAGRREPVLGVEPWGPMGDRRWAVVDATGGLVTARTAAELLHIRPGVSAGGLLLSWRHRRLGVAMPDHDMLIDVRISRVGRAVDAGEEAARFLSSVLGQPVRLVWQQDPEKRAISARNGGLAGESLSLADAGPVLLTSQSSLAALQEWVGSTPHLVQERFRPNVVIDGDVPFAEDTWTRVQLGAAGFRVQGPCDRCVMTTIDPATLDRGPQPLRALAEHRKWGGKVFFGVWLVPLDARPVRVGDAVRTTTR